MEKLSSSNPVVRYNVSMQYVSFAGQKSLNPLRTSYWLEVLGFSSQRQFWLSNEL